MTEDKIVSNCPVFGPRVAPRHVDFKCIRKTCGHTSTGYTDLPWSGGILGTCSVCESITAGINPSD